MRCVFCDLGVMIDGECDTCGKTYPATTTQYRAVLMDNDDPDYTVALRLDATSVRNAAMQADAASVRDWVNMRVISVEEVNAIQM